MVGSVTLTCHQIETVSYARSMSHWMRKFLDEKALVKKATECVIATEDGVVVGVFVFAVNRRVLDACGTYVERRYRRRGIARAMWDLAVHDARQNPAHREHISELYVVTMTRLGARFVEAVKSRLPLDVEHEQNWG